MIDKILASAALFIIIGLMYELIQMYKKNKYLKKVNSDLSIEFGGQNKTGIKLVKKQYPYMKDDWRQSTDEISVEDFKSITEPPTDEIRDSVDRPERHSIAGHMNDPSDTQKKAFNENNRGTL